MKRPAGARKKAFVYRKPPSTHLEQILRSHAWPEFLHAAYKNETAQLCEYLRSDLPLDERKRADLADLIERRVRRKGGRGRKPGRIPSPRLTHQDVVAYARRLVEQMKARNSGKLPRGSLKLALEQACRDLGEDGPNLQIDESQALLDLRRGKRNSK